MKSKILLIAILVMFLASTAFAPYPISFRNVSNPKLLERMLRDRIGTLDDDVATLQALTSGGVYDNIGTGDVFYVDSVTGSDTDTGLTWALAKATLDAGVGLCTDGNNDVIYVASGHAGVMAADVTFDIDSITVIGIGAGTLAPTFTFDTTTDEFIIDAIGVTLYNLRLVAGVADVATGIDCQDESDYFSIIACEIPEPGTATFDFTTVIGLTTGADNGTVAYCTFINQAATPGNSYFIDGGAAAIDSLTVIGNHVNADSAGALIFSDQADTNLIIANNTLIQEDVDKFCIELSSTATGIIANNLLCNLGGTAYLLDPGSCHLDGNKASVAIDAPSFDWPDISGEGRYVGTGTIFYVDRSGSNGDGRTWATAKTTINAAEALCTADASDVIYVAQNHYEDVTGADAVDLDVAGISVIGMGEGNSRPRIDLEDAAAEVVISKANITIKNIQLRPGATSVLKGIDIEAAGLDALIENVAFLNGEVAATDEFVDGIIVHNSAVGTTIRNCTYHSTGTDPDTFVNLDTGTAGNITIEDCTVWGDFDEAPIWGAAQVCTNLNIIDNVLTNNQSGQFCIEFSGAATGHCVGNRMYSDSYATMLDPGSMKCLDNWGVDAIDESGIPIPTIARPFSLLGTRVTRAAADIFDSTTTNLFTVAGGRVLITHLSMQNSIGACDATANNVKLVMNPTQGTDTDLCTTLDVADDEQYTLYSITGEFGDALVQSGAANSGAVQSMQNPIICAPGTIDLSSSGDSGSGGADVQTSVELWYFPLDDGATVVGA